MTCVFLRELFENPAFRPDGLKIYPTLVIRGTGLYEPYSTALHVLQTFEAFMTNAHFGIFRYSRCWPQVFAVQVRAVEVRSVCELPARHTG